MKPQRRRALDRVDSALSGVSMALVILAGMPADVDHETVKALSDAEDLLIKVWRTLREE